MAKSFAQLRSKPSYKKFLKSLRDLDPAGWAAAVDKEEGFIILTSEVAGRFCPIRFCPITAACFAQTSQYYGVGEARLAARDIGLRSVRFKIINAADRLKPYDRRIRRSLLRAVAHLRPENRS